MWDRIGMRSHCRCSRCLARRWARKSLRNFPQPARQAPRTHRFPRTDLQQTKREAEMVLSKVEVIGALQNEVRVLLHLVSKAEPSMLDYRPGSSQRSLLELLQYLTIMAPVHLRGVLAPKWSMDNWQKDFHENEAGGKKLGLEEAEASIAGQAALFAESLGSKSEGWFREELDMFGQKASRGLWLVRLVLVHYAAYRMQLFLYLKGCGREELNTMNLWVGIDGSMQPP